MKNFTLLLLSLLTLVSCTELKEMRRDINDLDTRVSELEEFCKVTNSNVVSLQTLVSALQTKDFVQM